MWPVIARRQRLAIIPILPSSPPQLAKIIVTRGRHHDYSWRFVAKTRSHQAKQACVAAQGDVIESPRGFNAERMSQGGGLP